MAAIFDIVVFGQRWNHCCTPLDLADAAEDYFGASVVSFESSAYRDGASSKAVDIADVFQVMRETTTVNGQAIASSQNSRK